MCCSPKVTLALGRFPASLKYSAIAAGFGATVFELVPQSTASGSYIAAIRAGSRLSYAARQAAVAAATSSFPPVPPPPVTVAQADNNATNGDPHEFWYRYMGREVGYTGNNGTIDTDYKDSIANRTRAPVANPGAFRWGSTSAMAHAARARPRPFAERYV